MNTYNRKPRNPLAVCPKCGMDSGERKCTVNIPTRYFIRCGTCGYIVGGNDNQYGASAQWNRESRSRWNTDDRE